MLPSELEELIEQAAREEWEELDLAGKNLTELPPSIGKLKSLKRLILGRISSGNKLTSLPLEISELTNLKSLALTENKITIFPMVITQLTNLQSLDLNRNQIVEIPEEITRLTSLESLDLGFNKIADTWLTNLQSILFQPTKEIPAIITRLKSLKFLYLYGNRLNKIPKAIAELTNLQFLDLGYNQIKDLPEEITYLKNLQSLVLTRNGLKKIPEEITRLKNLQSLKLNYNNITNIPKTISQLTNLKFLTLSENNLSEIPREIAQLKNLEKLDLSQNKITEITEVITRLNNLQSLRLNGNEIIEIPETIVNLVNLQSIDLEYNRIKFIPEAITRLKNLQRLYLSYNQITEVPPLIVNAKNLSILELLRSYRYLSIHNKSNYSENPITSPPLEIVEKGIESIREYFRQLEEGEDYLYEAKLLIIGEGGAGKTTLANKMINPDYQLCAADPTKGIEVKRWTFPLANGKTFAVNIWDFSGQEINHATHQYFLTKRSLYVLVADNRKEDTDFYYWLNVVALRSDNSPILIVKNEKHDLKREININQLRSEFNIKDTLATNLDTNRGLDKILETFKFLLPQLPHIGSALPKTWVKVRIELESNPRSYISLDEYLRICENNKFKQRKDALQLSEYLHDLGICLHFQDDETSPLYKTVILKPKWGTDAAYAVLDSPQVIKNFGRFSRQDLAQIWNSDDYSGMHAELLQLMMKFQLCYEIPQAKGNYIAPQLLTENQPEYDWDESDNLILRYSYDFMPKGIVRQFIVAMHQDIESQNIWRSGVIIKSQTISNTRAEVIENYGKREIKIRITGKNKKELLAIVLHELDKVHDLYPRLKEKYQKLIPCNCTTCKGNQSPHFYKFSDLKRRYENQKNTVECEISYENVNVLSLIDDVGEQSKLYDRIESEDRQYNREQSHLSPFNIHLTQTFNQEQIMSNPQTSFGGDYVRGDKIGGDKVGRDKIGTQINNSPNLAQAAKEIKELLVQLSDEYNPNTEKGQNSIKNEALKVIKNDSTLQQKIVNALKEGGVTALEEAINHPVAKIVIAATKGFLEG